jgi:hypothetical protein
MAETSMLKVKNKVGILTRHRTKKAPRAQKFENLADEWESETRHVASSKKIASHPLVREIVKMGRPAVPLILRRMKDRPWFWFHTLKELTRVKVDPVRPSMRGDMQQMTEAWIKWGENRGIIS